MALVDSGFEQVGGHLNAVTSSGDGTIKKKVKPSEAAFYNSLDSYPGIESLIPRCFAVQYEKGQHSVVLEDLTEGYVKPCVLDIKLGQRTWSHEMSRGKIFKRRLVDFVTSSPKLGLRLVGMNLWNAMDQRYERFRKNEVKHLRPGYTVGTLAHFFAPAGSSAWASLLERLHAIRDWFLEGHVQIYGSSLLFVYEGAQVDEPRPASVHMIDFPYVVPSEGEPDLGYVKGVDTLINLLSGLILND